ncbi:MAG: hypothetical protein HY330_03685 [Chloroflexi bacterium]|nr:hypothetical protein [Chloroflexota bacterium]
MILSQLRTRLRQDLHDQDPAAYRWTDAVLDRHVARALGELGLAIPRQATSDLVTSGSSRDLSLASLTDLVEVEAAEYPTGRFPASYVRFSSWGQTLTILIPEVPPAGAVVRVFYGRLHTLDEAGSTLPAHLEELLAAGAAAHAALEWANYAINRQNTGGADVWLHYFTWGQDRLAAFAQGLSQHTRRNRVRVRQLYPPATEPASRGADPGP